MNMCEKQQAVGNAVPGYAALTLLDIASWQSKPLAAGRHASIVAGIPSLQRGAVWNAGQVELLWDSMMRGFPVGSLVLCNKLPSQSTRPRVLDSGWSPEEVAYHLLDGQQRSNAIALGFLDPLSLDLSDEEDLAAALWLDLVPAPSKEGSTRQFLVCAHTKAHPWGYQSGDTAAPLGVAMIRKACEEYGHENQRPMVKNAWPISAKAPLPLAWLLDAALVLQLDGAALWLHISQRCAQHAELPWARKTAALIDSSSFAPALIESALQRLRATHVIALIVNDDVIRHDASGDAAEGDDALGISSIEHLFQRLNSAGTVLRGEELAYSMIKAYWPRIEESIAAIRDQHNEQHQPMPGSQLAALGARAALIDMTNPPVRLPAALSISRIRSMAHASLRVAEKQRLLEYFGIDNPQADATSFPGCDFHRNLRQVDAWLLYRPGADDFGLPAVLRTSLARSAPDVYLLLLYFAQRVGSEGQGQQQIEALRQPILALATALHWFCDRPDKAVNKLYSATFFQRELTAETFKGILGSIELSCGLRSPAQLAEIIPAPHAANLVSWNLWKITLRDNPDEESARRARDNPFIDRALKKRALLIYAQRQFMCRRFADFDPARVDTWKESNRPWDFDHILPSATLHNRRGVKHKRVCDQWVNGIGNLRAWPLEENRSKGKKTCTIDEDDKEQLIDSFIATTEHAAFGATPAMIDEPAVALTFVLAARTRTIRIYQEWFDNIGIAMLL